MRATDYKLAQRRTRVFLRGMRSGFASQLPPCLPPFGEVKLIDVLDPSLPATPRNILNLNRQKNLKDLLAKLEADKAAGEPYDCKQTS